MTHRPKNAGHGLVKQIRTRKKSKGVSEPVDDVPVPDPEIQEIRIEAEPDMTVDVDWRKTERSRVIRITANPSSRVFVGGTEKRPS